MIAVAIRLWIATWRPWRCPLPDQHGFPCGTRGRGACGWQEHQQEHRRTA